MGFSKPRGELHLKLDDEGAPLVARPVARDRKPQVRKLLRVAGEVHLFTVRRRVWNIATCGRGREEVISCPPPLGNAELDPKRRYGSFTAREPTRDG